MKLHFVVDRKAVGVNESYVRRSLRDGGKGLMLTSDAREFKEAIHAHAFAAVRMFKIWPRPDAVKAVQLEITIWNTKHDVGASDKLIGDALEGTVYANDRCIQRITTARRWDGKFPRVEIAVEILEVA